MGNDFRCQEICSRIQAGQTPEKVKGPPETTLLHLLPPGPIHTPHTHTKHIDKLAYVCVCIHTNTPHPCIKYTHKCISHTWANTIHTAHETPNMNTQTLHSTIEHSHTCTAMSHEMLCSVPKLRLQNPLYTANTALQRSSFY